MSSTAKTLPTQPSAGPPPGDAIAVYMRAVVAVGFALVAGLVGATVIAAVGNPVPDQLWVAASALTGALVGILVPSPQQRKAADIKQKAAAKTAGDHSNHVEALKAATKARATAAAKQDTARSDPTDENQKAAQDAAAHAADLQDVAVSAGATAAAADQAAVGEASGEPSTDQRLAWVIGLATAAAVLAFGLYAVPGTRGLCKAPSASSGGTTTTSTTATTTTTNTSATSRPTSAIPIFVDSSTAQSAGANNSSGTSSECPALKAADAVLAFALGAFAAALGILAPSPQDPTGVRTGGDGSSTPGTS